MRAARHPYCDAANQGVLAAPSGRTRPKHCLLTSAFWWTSIREPRRHCGTSWRWPCCRRLTILAKTGQTHAALAAYTALLQHFGDFSESADARRHVATALVDRSAAFAELGQLREALQDLLGLEQSFGADTDPITMRQLATGLANQAMVLRAIGRLDHALDVCNQLIARFAAHEDAVICDMVRQALQLRAELGLGAQQ